MKGTFMASHAGFESCCLGCPMALLCIGYSPESISQCRDCGEIFLMNAVYSEVDSFHHWEHILTATLSPPCPRSLTIPYHKCTREGRAYWMGRNTTRMRMEKPDG
jgi:hypothetical protein